MRVNLKLGNCLLRLACLPESSVDAIVTDPPYGISFMGAEWDKGVPSAAVWRECLRVIKPGGWLLAFASARTYHRMACNIEDGGFEIRDQIIWMYGSGMPHGLDVSKAIDKKLGAKRGKIRHKARPESSGTMSGSTQTRPWIEKSRELGYHEVDDNVPVSDDAKKWSGWNSALKPAHEPVVVARAPFRGTLVDNVLANGTGAINVDSTRIGDAGRWPANVVIDGSEEVLALFPDNAGAKAPVTGLEPTANGFSGVVKFSGMIGRVPGVFHDDEGSAARFFYVAKPSKAEKDASGKNPHPTVKPVTLMRYLIRLVTAAGGTVCDPFMGSGTTGVAAYHEGVAEFIGMEIGRSKFDYARARIAHAMRN